MRIAGVWSAFAFTVIVQASHSAETCSTEKLIGSCESMQKLGANVNGAKELGLPKYEDGSTIYNDLGLSRATKNDSKAPSPAQQERAISISEQIRAASINMIAGDTRLDLLTVEQKAMIARLKSVRILMSKGGPNDNCNSSPVSKIDPNASYNPWTHSLIICPPVAKLAPSALKMLMAHEFGHVVSPCQMKRDQYRVAPDKVASASTIEKCLGGKADVRFAQTMFPDQASNANLSSLDDLAPKYKSVVSKLSSCGTLAKKPDESGIQEPTVFGKLAGCLAKAYANNHANYLKVSSKGSRRSKETGPPADSKSLQCLGIYEEHFAEAIGSKVFASMLAGDGKQNETAKVGLVQMTGYACGEKTGRKEDPGTMFRYPSSADRVQIQMSDPNMQQALDCQMPKTTICTVDEVNTGSSPADVTIQSKGTSR